MDENPGSLRIGELLVQSGVLTPEQLTNRLELARVIGQPLGQILLESGDLSKYELVCALQIQSMVLDGLVSRELGVQSLQMVCREEADLQKACEQAGMDESKGATCRLGELLLAAEVITPPQLIEAITTSFQGCVPLGQVLVRARLVRPDVVAAALSLQREARKGTVRRAEAVEQIKALANAAPLHVPAGSRRTVPPDTADITPVLVDEHHDPLQRVREFIWHKIERSRFDDSTLSFTQTDATDLVGRIVAERYEVLSFIGAGGMSYVYQVRDLEDGKQLALKLMQPRHRGDEQIVLRFQQEARAVASLSHKNVVTVHDYGITEDGMMFFVMDYLRGTSLAQVIDKEGRLDMARALPIFIATCSAVGHAHTRGIIHRDLKPSNIMLVVGDGNDELVKIVDFGIAKVLPQTDEQEHRITRSGQLFGSPLYMSPEHCLGRTLSARSDIYSMGCVMYETITGRPPFSGATAFDIFFRHMHSNPEPLQSFVKDVPSLDGLEKIICTCLAKDPAKRFQSMEDLEQALKDLHDNPACDHKAARPGRRRKGKRS